MNDNVKIWSGYILLCILWGSTWMAIKLSLNSLTPLISLGARFAVASIFIFLLMKIKGLKLQLDKKSVKLYVILTLFSFAIPFAMVYWAEQHVDSGISSVLFGMFPFFVIIFSKLLMPEEYVGKEQILGVVFGFSGLVIIFSDNISGGFSNSLIGMGAIVVSSIIQGAVAVIVKRDGKHLHPLSMNLVPVFFASIFLLFLGVLFENTSRLKFDSYAIFPVLYLGFFGTVMTFTIYYWLMQKINVVILSLITFITPVVALLLGWIILDETLSFMDIAGTALVLAGIMFANTRGLKKLVGIPKRVGIE